MNPSNGNARKPEKLWRSCKTEGKDKRSQNRAVEMNKIEINSV